MYAMITLWFTRKQSSQVLSLIATFMYYDAYMSVALAAQGVAAVYSCCADMGNRNHFSLVTNYTLAIEWLG